MAKLLLLVLFAGGLDAAVIRGLVVEHQTGKPLARAVVAVQPLPGTAGPADSWVRADAYGAFAFPSLPAGGYLVSASRTGFLTARYGQKNWKAAGAPVILEENGSAFLNIRLWRFGAISGTIMDENEVGLPEHEVAAYRNTRPPVLVSKAKADDRGVYRLSGLLPGSYLVRTVGKQYTEGDYVPTFSRESATVDQALPVEVNVDESTDFVNVKPAMGRLVTLTGTVPGENYRPPRQFTVTLVSDMGRQSMVTTAAFEFHSLAPGQYEIFAESPPDSMRPDFLGGYQVLRLDRDENMRMVVSPIRATQFQFQSNKGQGLDPKGVQVMARRKDLAGPGPTRILQLTNSATLLAPGHWELAIAPNAAYYAADFSSARSVSGEKGRADGWNEMIVSGGYDVVRFVLSASPGGMHGTVTSGAHEPVAGAPVYLEAWDPIARKRLIDVRSTRTDLQGRYQFTGLAAGEYRVLGTFEYENPDSDAMDAAGARTIKIEEGHDHQIDLDLYVIR